MSDLHIDSYPSELWPEFLASLPAGNADVVVIAGDLSEGPFLQKAVIALAEHFAPTPVLFVRGNHDHWSVESPPVLDLPDNVTELDNSTKTIAGQRFVGTTLWYPTYEPGWCDFHYCHNAGRFIPRTYDAAHKFLRETVESTDVVVTHMLPTLYSVSPRWAFSDTNEFFVGPVDDVIVEKRPCLWVHGHTHDSRDYYYPGVPTRIVCNPSGMAWDRNQGFETAATIDLALPDPYAPTP